MSHEKPIQWKDKTAFVMPLLPPELKVDPVLAGLLHCMAFLELSGDETVDPDWAVEAMEYVATYLQRLPEEEASAIAQQLALVSTHGRKQGAPDTFLQFVGGFLESCGVKLH